jgi:hypothetical protein
MSYCARSSWAVQGLSRVRGHPKRNTSSVL